MNDRGPQPDGDEEAREEMALVRRVLRDRGLYKMLEEWDDLTPGRNGSITIHFTEGRVRRREWRLLSEDERTAKVS